MTVIRRKNCSQFDCEDVINNAGRRETLTRNLDSQKSANVFIFK
jgi:hypothetical protein